jgi:hypothetical protein
MFRTIPLSIIRSFSPYTQQMVYVIQVCRQLWAGSGWNQFHPDPTRKMSVWYITLLCVRWETPDDGQRNCPKHVEFHSKIKFEKISASSWFYYKDLSRCTVTCHDARSRVTMHGHMNVNSASVSSVILISYCCSFRRILLFRPLVILQRVATGPWSVRSSSYKTSQLICSRT